MVRRVVFFVLTSSLACTAPGGSDGQTGGDGIDSNGQADDGGSAGSDAASESGSPAMTYHPPGYAAPDVHGLAMKMHEEDCRQCHGADLAGGALEPSCDECHQPDWRTDCVYCHGGTMDSTGAPPRDIDGTTETSMLSFVAHRRHVSEYLHAAYDCVQCHRKPTDVLSEGHIFDDTDAVAEVDFSAGLSPSAQWDGAGTCASAYCHGNGQASNGTYAHDQPEPSCGGCHPYPGTENAAFATMSGEHARHANEGILCQECHDPDALLLHVDGKADVAIPTSGFTWDPGSQRCTGLCHLRSHDELW